MHRETAQQLQLYLLVSLLFVSACSIQGFSANILPTNSKAQMKLLFSFNKCHYRSKTNHWVCFCKYLGTFISNIITRRIPVATNSNSIFFYHFRNVPIQMVDSEFVRKK